MNQQRCQIVGNRIKLSPTVIGSRTPGWPLVIPPDHLTDARDFGSSFDWPTGLNPVDTFVWERLLCSTPTGGAKVDVVGGFGVGSHGVDRLVYQSVTIVTKSCSVS